MLDGRKDNQILKRDKDLQISFLSKFIVLKNGSINILLLKKYMHTCLLFMRKIAPRLLHLPFTKGCYSMSGIGKLQPLDQIQSVACFSSCELRKIFTFFNVNPFPCYFWVEQKQKTIFLQESFWSTGLSPIICEIIKQEIKFQRGKCFHLCVSVSLQYKKTQVFPLFEKLIFSYYFLLFDGIIRNMKCYCVLFPLL